MATTKTFSVAGVSTVNGQTKIRFANDYVGRFKVLIKNEHTDIKLIELGGEFTKEQICQVLMSHPDFQDEVSQTAITEYAVRNIKSQKETVEVEQPVAEDAPF